MLSDQDRKSIIAQGEAFIDNQFAPLDLRGFPSLNPLPDQRFEASDSRGLNNVVVAGANPLKAFADHPDDETVARIAEETSDPDLATNLLDQQEERVALEFMRTHPTWQKSEWNYERIRGYLEAKGQEFNLANLHDAFLFLTRTGQLETRPGVAKRLDDSELLQVVNCVKAGDLQNAVGLYLDLSLPHAEDTWDSTDEFLSDPRTLPVRNAACRFVWLQSRPVIDSPELREFEKKYFRLRPVHTIQDLDDCFAQYEKYDKQMQRQQMLQGVQPEPLTAADLEDLDDASVNRLAAQTFQARARQMLKEQWRTNSAHLTGFC